MNINVHILKVCDFILNLWCISEILPFYWKLFSWRIVTTQLIELILVKHFILCKDINIDSVIQWPQINWSLFLSFLLSSLVLSSYLRVWFLFLSHTNIVKGICMKKRLKVHVLFVLSNLEMYTSAESA